LLLFRFFFLFFFELGRRGERLRDLECRRRRRGGGESSSDDGDERLDDSDVELREGDLRRERRRDFFFFRSLCDSRLREPRLCPPSVGLELLTLVRMMSKAVCSLHMKVLMSHEAQRATLGEVDKRFQPRPCTVLSIMNVLGLVDLQMVANHFLIRI
jgi:hypothetical protein